MSSVLGIVGHRSRVRALYKAILRLHKGMPPELKEIGDKYVKEEFKRHKDAEAPFVVVFMKEWANYAYTLAQQLENSTAIEPHSFGKAFGAKDLELLTEDQTVQLLELFKETHPGVVKESVTSAPETSSDDLSAAAAESNQTETKDLRHSVPNQDKP